MNTADKRLDDLTEKQQKACWAFARKYGQDVHVVAGHLDTFFRLAHGDLTILQAERETGLVIIDHTHPCLF